MGFKVLHKLENWCGTWGAGAVSVTVECLKRDVCRKGGLCIDLLEIRRMKWTSG